MSSAECNFGMEEMKKSVLWQYNYVYLSLNQNIWEEPVLGPPGPCWSHAYAYIYITKIDIDKDTVSPDENNQLVKY